MASSDEASDRLYNVLANAGVVLGCFSCLLSRLVLASAMQQSGRAPKEAETLWACQGIPGKLEALHTASTDPVNCHAVEYWI